jgi:two-component system sensor histidine kinase/response regulator
VAEAILQPAAEAGLPSGIEGLDVTTGLRRVLGKKRLYLSMLHKFVAGQKFVISEIRKALADNFHEIAERLAHTLKGTSGNIGAAELQQLAEKLEVAIQARQPREEIEVRLSEVERPLSHLIAQLEQQLPEDQGKTKIKVDRRHLKEVCDQLEALLIYDDAAVVGVLDANADLLNAAFPEHYRKIDGDIRSFNFDAGLAALKAARTSAEK